MQKIIKVDKKKVTKNDCNKIKYKREIDKILYPQNMK